jgi:hypothetical protein
MTKEPIAAALRATLVSPNVSDSNMEAANIVDVIDNGSRALWSLAGALNRLGSSDDRSGAIEQLSAEIKHGSERIADALLAVASALREKQ